jgi:hypothetical protein
MATAPNFEVTAEILTLLESSLEKEASPKYKTIYY